jgi:hypothetical protein
MSDPTTRVEQQRNCEIEDLSKLKADAARAATVLRELYGRGALERAKRLERRSPQSHFARMVTADVLRKT